MNNAHKIQRRDFVRNVASLGLFTIVPARVLNAATAPSNQITRALIGYGVIARTANHLKYKGSRLVGICDPFKARVEFGLAECEKFGWGKVKAYRDFVELLADKGVDVVHVCTPPHWHGCMNVMAAKAGKDIWAEKPMTRTLGEGRRVMEVVKGNGRMFRLNTWFRFKGEYYSFGTTVKSIKKVVDSGLLGDGPKRVVVGKGQGLLWARRWSGKSTLPVDDTPEGLDWEMWLGPAPWRPFSEHRVSVDFRSYWDYDNGDVGDMAQHYLDPVQYLLGKDETSPVRVDYEGPRQHPEAVGVFDRITLKYADGDTIILDGNESLAGEPYMEGSNGAKIFGKPFRVVDADGKELDTAKLLADLPEPPAQVTDFMESVRERKTFALNECNGFRSCALMQLGAAAMRLGRGFDFDPVALRAVDDPAADRFLYQGMREPWRKEMYS